MADWTIIDKIEESQAEVKKTIQQIRDVRNKLTSMLAAAEKAQTQTKLDELIVNIAL